MCTFPAAIQESHFEGKKHKLNVARLYCRICNKHFERKHDFDSHLTGKKHREKEKVAKKKLEEVQELQEKSSRAETKNGIQLNYIN